MSLAIIEAVIVGIVLFCCRYVLGYAYSNEKELVHYIGVMTPLICLSIFMDSIQAVLSGQLLHISIPSIFLLSAIYAN